MINFSVTDLQQCLPTNHNVSTWYQPLLTVLPQFQITTVNRVAAFLAQCGEESSDFNILSENLNYSAQGLLSTFPKEFTAATAAQYARQPQAIANIAYANRLGNGDVSSGDGWNYRGRGLIQVTGKANYSACSTVMYGNDTLVQNPDLLTAPTGAIQSAVWFWNVHGLNTYADTNQITAMSIKINGSTTGVANRIARYNHCWSILHNANPVS
jgi:putative chitinase